MIEIDHRQCCISNIIDKDRSSGPYLVIMIIIFKNQLDRRKYIDDWALVVPQELIFLELWDCFN